MISLLNPKAILFFISFFVQFVDPAYPYPAVSFLVLALILQVFSMLYLTALIFGGTWLTSRFTRASLSDDLQWADVFAVATLAGIGFTVSLLIGELAFEDDAAMTSEVKAAVLTGSLIAAALATVLLKIRNAKYRGMVAEEERDDDADETEGRDAQNQDQALEALQLDHQQRQHQH